MRHFKLTAASLIAGAALALTACGGGGEANNSAGNDLGNADFGNAGDPSALETMNNGTGDTGLGNAGTGSGAGTGTTTPPPPANSSAGDIGPTGDTGGTDAGGDTGGNTDSGTVNGM